MQTVTRACLTAARAGQTFGVVDVLALFPLGQQVSRLPLELLWQNVVLPLVVEPHSSKIEDTIDPWASYATTGGDPFEDEDEATPSRGAGFDETTRVVEPLPEVVAGSIPPSRWPLAASVDSSIPPPPSSIARPYKAMPPPVPAAGIRRP
jgi:hypothetical protein